MDEMDRMPKAFRALVHEYGFMIVRHMRDDGYSRPKALKPILEQWRAKRQAEWLNTDYVTKGRSTGRHFAQALGDG